MEYRKLKQSALMKRICPGKGGIGKHYEK